MSQKPDKELTQLCDFYSKYPDIGKVEIDEEVLSYNKGKNLAISVKGLPSNRVHDSTVNSIQGNNNIVKNSKVDKVIGDNNEIEDCNFG